MSWAEQLTPVAIGAVRLVVPLAAIIIAALLFIRVRLINIALDGQVGLAAIVYVAAATAGGATVLGSFVGILGAVLASAAVGIGLAALARFRATDTILLSFGLLYACQGTASVISNATSGQPGNAQLDPQLAIGEWPLAALVVLVVIVTILALFLWRPFRVSKVIGETEGIGLNLSALSGMDTWGWICLNAALGSLLLALAGIYLVEQGGSYTKFVSGNRGFLALAIVAVTRRSVVLYVVIAVVFGVLQRIAMGPRQESDLAQAIPFLVALVLLAAIGITSRYWDRERRRLVRRIPS